MPLAPFAPDGPGNPGAPRRPCGPIGPVKPVAPGEPISSNPIEFYEKLLYLLKFLEQNRFITITSFIIMITGSV